MDGIVVGFVAILAVAFAAARGIAIARGRSLDTTGFGLAIVRHIVEGHGGAIRVESGEGEGSIFTFTLPIPAAIAAPVAVA